MDVLVVLMTYGSPDTLDDIPGYLRNIRGGREPDSALVEEFRRRYKLIGGSPLVKITNEQASLLESNLRGRGDGNIYRARAGMRFSAPFVRDVVKEASPQSGVVMGLIMSPQFSPIIMGGYVKSIEESVAALRAERLQVKVSRDWHLQPKFIEALAQRVREALARIPVEVRDRVPVLLTAHSMPKRVVEGEPGYITQLQETAAAVADRAGLRRGMWMFCYQSAGHTPEEWLKPDFADMMPQLRKEGCSDVLIAPVQFLADHLEVLYDIDVGAREQAEKHGLAFHRIESLNTSPAFIAALADVVQTTIK
jgi:ferrochelatase